MLLNFLKKKTPSLIIFCILTFSFAGDWIDYNKNGKMDIYEDSTKSIEERVEDLLSQMTLDEKTMQMVTLYGYTRVLPDALPVERWKKEYWKDGIANIDEHHNGVERSKGKYDWPASLHTDTINKTQKWFIEETRLGIPVDFTNEGTRGLCNTGATNLPAAIAMGATWDKNIVYQTGKVVGKEAYALGYTNIYSPILDVPRDQRWGRTVECYGEDPFLVAEMGIARAKGIRSENIGVTCKHFAAYGTPNGGRDGHARTDPKVTPRELEMIDLYPFERVIKEVGIQSIMSSYNDWDGVPISGSSLFMQTILRDRMGFTGYVVSDSGAVDFLWWKHRTQPNFDNAVKKFVLAGGDVQTTFVTPSYFVKPLRNWIASGDIPMSVIDDRVRNVLYAKFELGLFEEPYRNIEGADAIVNCAAHKAVALEACRKAVVLLKNADNTLPLKKDKSLKILVTGPNSDDKKICMSRYSGGDKVITVLDGMKSIFDGEITYKKGCNHCSKNWPQTEIIPEPLTAEELSKMEEAVEEAKNSDVVIAVMGDAHEMIGESPSRSSLDLPPLQKELLRRLHATGKPIIAVLLNGRAVSANWTDANCPAVIEGWFGGEYTGQAIAEIIFGDYNPGGKLPLTFPKTVGQLPLNFPAKPFSQAGQGKAGDPNGSGNSRIMGPQYPFGYGLSYTTFKYSNMVVSANEITAKDSLTVSCDITNTGKLAGDEIVQLYINDKFSSVSTYERLLRDFDRISLAPGESKTVTFTLKPKDDFWMINEKYDRIVEPGEFEIMFGSSSSDIRLNKTIKVIGDELFISNGYFKQ